MYRLLCVIVLFLPGACGKALKEAPYQLQEEVPAGPNPPPPGPFPPQPTPSHWEDLEGQVNVTRRDAGISILASEAALHCAAQMQAQDLERTGRCGHIGSDGSRFWERARRCGLRAGYASGEIVACGQRSEAEAIQGWLGSPGHRNILLDPAQVWMGAGVAGSVRVVVFAKG